MEFLAPDGVKRRLQIKKGGVAQKIDEAAPPGIIPRLKLMSQAEKVRQADTESRYARQDARKEWLNKSIFRRIRHFFMPYDYEQMDGKAKQKRKPQAVRKDPPRDFPKKDQQHFSIDDRVEMSQARRAWLKKHWIKNAFRAYDPEELNAIIRGERTGKREIWKPNKSVRRRR